MPKKAKLTISGIHIISTPSGEAPEWVRKAWEGLILPTVSNGSEELTVVEFISHKRKEKKGYRVDGGTAIALLWKHNKKAAKWWLLNVILILETTCVFDPDCCEPLTIHNPNQLYNSIEQALDQLLVWRATERILPKN